MLRLPGCHAHRLQLASLRRAVVFLATMAASLALGTCAAQASFEFGLQDNALLAQPGSAQTRTALAAMRTVHGSVVRLGLIWAAIAPSGQSRPAGFDAADPADPHYHWAAVDAAVRSAAQHHFRPVMFFADAPAWAEQGRPTSPYVSAGAWNPNPTDYTAFVRAAALRYSGRFPDPLRPGRQLPRVSDWEPWNEPNIPGNFSAPHPVSAYRTLLNRAYGVIKGVNRGNTVALGGLAPVSPVPGSTPPLDFGAQLLCVHQVGVAYRPTRRCQPARFDAYAVHPYSLAATPTKHAYKPGDDLVGDMGRVQALVRAADRLRTDAPHIAHQIWVTEFSWLTNPPDPSLGDPESVAARYVAYSLYEMWKSGVNLVVWFEADDRPSTDPIHSAGGLYFSPNKPKLTLSAFAFPVVAAINRGTGMVWGRAPVSRSASIVVERAVGHRWAAVARLTTRSDGVFTVRFAASKNGSYRAKVVGGPTSLGYDSRPIPPRRTHLQ